MEEKLKKQDILKLLGVYEKVAKENPTKYKNEGDFFENFQSDPEIMGNIQELIESITPEEISELDSKYAEQLAQLDLEDENETMLAKNGGKLEHIKKLQAYKKGGKMKSKKCACGCNLVETKEAGGKITSKCACGCSVKKKETGGVVDKVASMKKKAAKKK